jgi:DNA-binding NtrC family response regulator
MKILLVEDDDELRILLEERLTNAGHQITSARDGAEACRLMVQGSTDVLVTDILMPEKDGLDVIKEFRRVQPRSRIVAISGGGPGVATNLCLHLAHHLGACEILKKPFHFDQLLRAVENPGSPGSEASGKTDAS